MAFLNQRLSEEVAYGFSGGPSWQTLIIEMDNGNEARNAQWLYPKHRYTAAYEDIAETARDAILQAFHACRGRLHAFRFKDWNDYKAVSEPVINIQVGTRNPAQLIKAYEFGTEQSTRLIQAVSSATLIGPNGANVPGSVDLTTGLFTPSANWAAGSYFWSGEFDVWVRFDNDYNAFTIGSWQHHSANIELVEVRRRA
ncbi:hypothetical protein [Xanthomonas phage XAJ2]|uniref:DUF2460 domain-containing protein n=1 Tax=Xanthomonas phage XAJ2 TaxID=1775249 RepID=A0A1I9L2F0_9CAUD|nr:hypothetical protein [Xanthomonas phage XAJ2]